MPDILPIPLEYYSYAKYLKTLLHFAHLHKFKSNIIGHELFETLSMDYPLYGFVVNPEAKLQFCIVAGVQAYEIAGPLAILELFKDPHKYLSKDICYHIYPMINPTSFDLRQRQDDDGKDLNLLDSRVFNNPVFKEVQAFYNDIKSKDFEVFVSFHEDVDEHRFYTYAFEKGEKNPVYRMLISKASERAHILRTPLMYGDIVDEAGLILNHHDHSFEDYLFSRGRAKISLCTETPGKLPLETRIQMDLENIKLLTEWVLIRARGE